jgi:bifunctional DNA-binding transcriptional regulator/antitoxin component of YhaV-PrlF toxin-antitoxin module
MQLKTNITKNGGSLYLLIPPSLIEYLGLEPGDANIIIEDKEKGKGKYAAFWKTSDTRKMQDAKDTTGKMGDVPDTGGEGLEGSGETGNPCGERENTEQLIARCHRRNKQGIWSAEPDVGRVADGIPSRVDRIKCLGNAVVPQVAEVVGEMILEMEKKKECVGAYDNEGNLPEDAGARWKTPREMAEQIIHQIEHARAVKPIPPTPKGVGILGVIL